jgi:predicted outer membrane lipoprotein
MSPAHPKSSSSLRWFSHLVLATLLACTFGVQAADFYRWTDDKGVTHFSDKPPKGVNAEKVKGKKPRPSGEEEEVVAEEPQASDPDAERCKAERERLALLQSNRRIQMEDKEGKVRELTVKEIEEEIAFSQKAVERFCNP